MGTGAGRGRIRASVGGLGAVEVSRWLDCRTQEPRNVADLLRPADDGYFEAIPISDRVNKVANTGPELLEKVSVVTNNEPKPQKSAADDRQIRLL